MEVKTSIGQVEGLFSSSISLWISCTSTLAWGNGSTYWIGGIFWCSGFSTLWIACGGGWGISSCGWTCGIASWTFYFFTGGSTIASCASISELIFSKFFLNSTALCKISNVEEGCAFLGTSRTTFYLSFNLLETAKELNDASLASFSAFYLCISSYTFN